MYVCALCTYQLWNQISFRVIPLFSAKCADGVPNFLSRAVNSSKSALGSSRRNRPPRNDIDINPLPRYKYRTSTDIYIQVDRVSICDMPQLSRYNRSKREITAESISGVERVFARARRDIWRARKYRGRYLAPSAICATDG